MSAPQVPYPQQAPYPPQQPSFPQMPYDPPPPYNPNAGHDSYPQPGWISTPQMPPQQQPPQASVFNPAAQGYVKQGSTYVPTGQPGVMAPAGYYPSGGQPTAGYFNGAPQPAGYYPGQPAPAQGYYGATGYPGGSNVVVREQTQETSRMDDLAKCCLGTCCLTWFCCWLTD